MMPITVLVTAAGSMPGVAVINALKRQQDLPIRVLSADMYPLCAGRYLSDGFAAVPPARDSSYLESLFDVCLREGVGVVFPILDEEQLIFSQHRARFERHGIRIIVNDADVVRLTLDKYQTYRFCCAQGIRVPRTLLAEEAIRAETLAFPVVVKPRTGRGSVGVSIVADRAALASSLARLRDPIVQQFLDGREYTIDVLTDFQGEVISVVPKARLATKAGIQVKGVTVRDGRLLDYGEMIARAFRLAPRANIQCVDTPSGLHLIEVNPKFPASLPFTVAAGVNAPLLLVQMSLGIPVGTMVGRFRDGLLMVRYWQEIFVERTQLSQEDLTDEVFGSVLADAPREYAPRR